MRGVIGYRSDTEIVYRHQRGKPRSKDGYTIYLVYNEDYGITAMGVAARGLESFQAKRSVVTQLVLVAKRGLLAPGSTLVPGDAP